MHPSGNGPSESSKDNSKGGQAGGGKESAAIANGTSSKGHSGQPVSSGGFLSTGESKNEKNSTIKKKNTSKFDSSGKGVAFSQENASSPLKKSKGFKDGLSKGHDLQLLTANQSDSLNLINIENQSYVKTQDTVAHKQSSQFTPHKGKITLTQHKQKNSLQKISPTQAKGNRMEHFKSTIVPNGLQHSSLGQQGQTSDILVMNSQLSGYRLDGQNIHLQNSQTPIMIKGKTDGLGGGSSVGHHVDSGNVVQIGQHLTNNKIYKTPFIQSSIKSHGLADNFVGLNGHVITDIDGNMFQPSSMKQSSHGAFNSKGQQLSSVQESVQITPRRFVSGLTFDEIENVNAAYHDFHKGSQSKQKQRQVINAQASFQNYYQKKTSIASVNQYHHPLGHNMMIQGKNSNQLQKEISNYQKILVSDQINGKNSKQLAQSQDSRPLTGQQHDGGQGGEGYYKPKIEIGLNNKSTHILLPQKDQMHEIQNLKSKINVVSKQIPPTFQNEVLVNNSINMSAPGVKIIEVQGNTPDNFNIIDQDKYIKHLESQERGSKGQQQQVDIGQYNNKSNPTTENYKSLQVNRSNTTTGYIAGVKTQVQLSQNLQQHSVNQHLTTNGMHILNNGIVNALGGLKQSYTEEKPQESGRLIREQSEINIPANRFPLNNKNSHVRKLVSNFKVHGKRAPNDILDSKNNRASKVFKHKRNSQNQHFPGQSDILSSSSPEKNVDFKDYPVSDPSRNVNVNTKNQDNFSQSTKDGEMMAAVNKETAFQIQPTIVFSAKTTAHPVNATMNTVEDEIFQNNGRQITEGYNSFKMAQLLNKKGGSKSKSSIGAPTVQSHQLNMQLFEMQFLKGQDNQILGVQQLPGQYQAQSAAVALQEQLARQQQQLNSSPNKSNTMNLQPKNSAQIGLQKNQTFGGYTYNASKPNNLIYSVHHHIQNADQIQTGMTQNQGSSVAQTPFVGTAAAGQMAQQQNGILYHKPTNSNSILALQNQTPSTVRQDQIILQNAIKAQHANNPMALVSQVSAEKKLLKVKDITSMVSAPSQFAGVEAHKDDYTIVQKGMKGHNIIQANHQPSSNLIMQHKTLAKGGSSHHATQSNTQIGRHIMPKMNSQQRHNRAEETNLFTGSLMNGYIAGQINHQEAQIAKGLNTLQQAIQNLWSEQERIVAEIFSTNKHIDPNNLNMIIQSQLSSVKAQQANHFMLGQKFVHQPFRNAAMHGSQVSRQNSNQLDIMNNYKTQLEGLQALKNLQEFLEISAQSNVNQLIQNRSKFMMQSGYGSIGIPQHLVKQLQPKKAPTDLYGNPISLEKQKSKIPFENAYVEDCYKYIIMPGNNSQLIRKALERRSWWIEIQPVHSLFNFRWQPLSHGIRFDRLGARQPKHGENYGMGTQVTTFNATMGGGPQSNNENIESHKAPTLSEINHRQVVNHLEFHQLITEKFNLLHSMQKFCDLNKENVFDYLPVTFYIEMPNFQKESAYNAAMQPFLQYFQVLEDHKEIIHELKQELVKLQEKEEERERLLAEQKELENANMENNEGEEGKQNGDPGAGSESDGGIDAIRTAEDDGEPVADGNAETSEKNNALDDLEASQKKEKGLLNNQFGFSTVYKTPGKENTNNKSTKFKSFNFEKRNHMRLTCPVSHFDGHNLWLLKPTHLNRGRGIHVFNDLATLHKLIKEYCVGKDEESWKKKSKVQTEKQNEDDEKGDEMKNGGDDGNISPLYGPTESPLRKSTTKLGKDPESALHPVTSEKKAKTTCFKIKHNTFIIQKYIERPLLICNRKFDIRVWVLLDQDHNLYLFKEGYIRTSASIFSIDSNHIDNAAVHLTNNAVQKALDSYGQFEDGNQLSYDRFQQILLEEQPDCGVNVRRDIVPAMKHHILKSIYSVRKTIDPYKRKYCFELFGYDFIIDEDFNTWLIEVNTNPCLEESSQMLKLYLPRMIEDMLKITIDQIFPRVTKKKKLPIGGHGSNQKDIHNSPMKMKNRKLSSVGPGTLNQKNFRGNLKIQKQVSQVDTKKKDPSDLAVSSPKREHEESVKIEENVNQSTDEKINVLDGGVEKIREENQAQESEEEDEEKKAQEMAAKYARRIHPVRGYNDTENMWEKLLNIEKTPVCPTQPPRFQNNKSRFNIAVQEKVFKIKKNPVYMPYNRPERPISNYPPKINELQANEDAGDQNHKSPQNDSKKKQPSQNEIIVAQAQQAVQNSKVDSEEKSKQLGS